MKNISDLLPTGSCAFSAFSGVAARRGAGEHCGHTIKRNIRISCSIIVPCPRCEANRPVPLRHRRLCANARGAETPWLELFCLGQLKNQATKAPRTHVPQTLTAQGLREKHPARCGLEREVSSPSYPGSIEIYFSAKDTWWSPDPTTACPIHPPPTETRSFENHPKIKP